MRENEERLRMAKREKEREREGKGGLWMEGWGDDTEERRL